MKLISMIDYTFKVIQTPNKNEFPCYEQASDRLFKLENYARFLKKSLTLGMFLPCDLEGNYLEKPINSDVSAKYWKELNQEYNEAKERVLFKGFEYIELDGWECIKYNQFTYRIDTFLNMFSTIEKLNISRSEYELTEAAIKQIN